MSHNQILLLTPLVAVVALLHSPDANACSCGPVNIDTAITASEAIAVVSIEKTPTEAQMRAARTNVMYSAKIEKVFKGDATAGATQPLVTAASSSACGRKYEQGKRYVLFVGARDGNWYDNSCSASAQLDAQGQHAHLAAIEKWVADGKDLKVPAASPKGPAHKPVDPAAKDGTPPPSGDTNPATPPAPTDPNANAADPATPTPAAPASPPPAAKTPDGSPAPTAEKPEPASSCAAAPLALGWPALSLLVWGRRRRRR